MSSLWMETSNVSDKILYYVPSPMCNSLIRNSRVLPFIEKIYLLISWRGEKERSSRGSMTVEAAVVVPLLILFILHLGSCMEMLRLHGRLEYALWQVGRELAVYGAAESRIHTPGTGPDRTEDITGGSARGEGSHIVTGLAVSYLYVNGRLGQILGRDYLDSSPLAYGQRGISYLSSAYMEEEECIDIVLTYQVCPQITCFPFSRFRMVSRYYGRAWTGFAVGDGAKPVTYVYVTEDGAVWHSRGDCSYLKLSIQEVQAGTVWMLRNETGERYQPCGRCADRLPESLVYLTREGNRYHSVRSCPSLTRRVHAVVWQENMPYRPCSRCAATRPYHQ